MMENELLLQRQQPGGGRLFECKTCGRRFPTFQALGGHRASHRRPGPSGFVTGIRKLEAACAGGPRVHGCPICGAEFAVGQALGGHMRRHRAAAASAGTQAEICSSGDTASATVENRGEDCVRGICLELNLALPACCAKCQKDAGLGSKVQGVQKNFVFDCNL